MGASLTTHTPTSVQAGQARGYTGRYFILFRSVLSLVHLSHSHASLHTWCLTIHRWSVSCVSLLGRNSSDIISNLLIVPEDQTSLNGARFAAGEVLIPSPNAASPPLWSTPRTVTPVQTMTRGETRSLPSPSTPQIENSRSSTNYLHIQG